MCESITTVHTILNGSSSYELWRLLWCSNQEGDLEAYAASLIPKPWKSLWPSKYGSTICFWEIHEKNLKSTPAVYEYLSFIFWTLTITTLLKYTIIVLRADDEGEGGVFALYSLLCRHAKVGLLPNDRTENSIVNSDADSSRSSKVKSRARKAIEKHKSSHYLMIFLAFFGSCMMIGDAVFTPSISVLSASFGLQRSLSKVSKHCKNNTTDKFDPILLVFTFT